VTIMTTVREAFDTMAYGPAPEADKLHELVGVIHSIVRDDAK